MAVGRGSVAVLGVLMVSGLLAGCGSGGSVPPAPEDAENVVVRVSGTEGVSYSGTYGSLDQEPRLVDETLGGEPANYDVQIEQGVSDGVIAGFQKVQPGGGSLKAEILADGEVVVESTTYAEFGAVNVDWLPQIGPPEDVPPEEPLPGDVSSLEPLPEEDSPGGGSLDEGSPKEGSSKEGSSKEGSSKDIP